MAVDGKWIEGLQPAMSLADATRAAFAARFAAVIDRWREAQDKPQDPDPIHHLRVASRRAAAALCAFGDRLPRRRCRQLRVHLRKIRRAAGRVRDRDVFLQQLSSWMKDREAAEQPGLDYLCGIWRHQRERLRNKLQPHLSDHDQFADRVEPLPVRGGRKTALGERARVAVHELLDEFAMAVTGDSTDPESLHAIRIAGKHLRYGMELFAACIVPGQLDGPYALIEELQDLLGEAHDAEVNARRVQRELDTLAECGDEVAARYRPGVEHWLTQLQSVEIAGPVRFGDWMSRWVAVNTNFDFQPPRHSENPSN